MRHDAFLDRERAEEAAYFAQRDARLIEKIRARARLGEIAAALADKLHVDDPQLLDRIVALGVTRDTAAAFLLAPLVEVAWADGNVGAEEYETIVRLASARGVPHDSPDMAQILQWLKDRPSHALVEAALDAIRIGISLLPADEREQRVNWMIGGCGEVARATGEGHWAPAVGGNVSTSEMAVIARIRARLMS